MGLRKTMSFRCTAGVLQSLLELQAKNPCPLSSRGEGGVSRPGHKYSGAGSTKHHLCRHSPITSASPSYPLPHLTHLNKRHLLPGTFSEYSRNFSLNNRKQDIIFIVSKSHEEAELSLIHSLYGLVSPCWSCHMGQVPLPVWPAYISAVLTLSSKASQVDTISRTSGVHMSCLYSASWDDGPLFPPSLSFTAIWLGRSCPAQPSPVPPLWEVSKRGFHNLESKGGDGTLPQMIEMFQGTFPKMATDMWEENQECFISDCREFVEFVGLLLRFAVRVCLCE